MFADVAAPLPDDDDDDDARPDVARESVQKQRTELINIHKH